MGGLDFFGGGERTGGRGKGGREGGGFGGEGRAEKGGDSSCVVGVVGVIGVIGVAFSFLSMIIITIEFPFLFLE